MTPITPFDESPTGRLVELVYLLSDRPLPLVHQAVLDAEGEDVDTGDPLDVVASALERLNTMTELTLWSRHQHRRLAEAISAETTAPESALADRQLTST